MHSICALCLNANSFQNPKNETSLQKALIILHEYISKPKFHNKLSSSIKMRSKVLPWKANWTIKAWGPEGSPVRASSACRSPTSRSWGCHGPAAPASPFPTLSFPSNPKQRTPLRGQQLPTPPYLPHRQPALPAPPSNLPRDPWDIRHGGKSEHFLSKKWLGSPTHLFRASRKDC